MIGKTIRELRERRGYSQAQLAELLHISDRTVSSWEVNRTEPNMGMIEKLAEVLKVRKSEIIGEAALLTAEEMDFFKKYRMLDLDGKNTVNLILETQYTRCIKNIKEKDGRHSA